jgi:predicted peroxiredoxin
MDEILHARELEQAKDYSIRTGTLVGVWLCEEGERTRHITAPELRELVEEAGEELEDAEGCSIRTSITSGVWLYVDESPVKHVTPIELRDYVEEAEDA